MIHDYLCYLISILLDNKMYGTILLSAGKTPTKCCHENTLWTIIILLNINVDRSRGVGVGLLAYFV